MARAIFAVALFAVALLVLAVPAIAASSSSDDPSGEPIESSNYMGPWYSCTFTGPTAAGGIVTITKGHQGYWHAKRLEALGWVCTLLGGSSSAPAPESSALECRADGDTPTAVPVSEVLSTDPGERSLADGWRAPVAELGNVAGGTNIGAYHAVCEPAPSSPSSWLSNVGAGEPMSSPDTAYAIPVKP